MLLKLLGGAAIAYGVANILLLNFASIDLGTFLTVGAKDYTGAAAIALGSVLFSLGERPDEAADAD